MIDNVNTPAHYISANGVECIEAIKAAMTTEEFFGTQAMRAAYDLGRDDQLEQVVEWLRHNLGSVPLDPVGYSGYTIDVACVIEDLREDMRPTNNHEDDQ